MPKVRGNALKQMPEAEQDTQGPPQESEHTEATANNEIEREDEEVAAEGAPPRKDHGELMDEAGDDGVQDRVWKIPIPSPQRPRPDPYKPEMIMVRPRGVGAVGNPADGSARRELVVDGWDLDSMSSIALGGALPGPGASGNSSSGGT